MIFMQISTVSTDKKNMPESAYSGGQTPTAWQVCLQQVMFTDHEYRFYNQPM